MTEPHIITLEDPPSLGSKLRVYVEAQPVAELLERLASATEKGIVGNPSTLAEQEAHVERLGGVLLEAEALLAALRKHESRPP